MFRKFIVVGFGIKVVTKLGKYLGTYVDHHKDSANIGNEILAKMTKKLQGWKAGMLPQVDRLTLCKVVLQSLLVYYMSTTLIPKNILQKK